jgi:hypothetical protein
MTCRTILPLALALLALPGGGQAQDTPKAEATKTETSTERRGPAVILRVQLVISRFQGEKKLASLPYTLLVTTGGARARMRMGVDTPVPVTSTSDGGKQTTSIQYRNVGTNIDCAAWDRGDGRYQVSIGVENSSTLPFEKGPSSAVNPGGPLVDANPTGIPLFRGFNTSVDPILRDGQTLQTVASTDPVTGEVVKIDVTLNVVK